jgi:SPP1 family predicted phage head-tail adaptor
MQAGKMDRHVFIDRPTVTQNTLGEEITVWVQAARVWASWRRASSNETLAGAEIAASVSDVFEIRYSSQVADVEPKWRLTYQGTEYDIVTVDEVGRREGLRIGAVARSDG